MKYLRYRSLKTPTICAVKHQFSYPPFPLFTLCSIPFAKKSCSVALYKYLLLVCCLWIILNEYHTELVHSQSNTL